MGKEVGERMEKGGVGAADGKGVRKKVKEKERGWRGKAKAKGRGRKCRRS